MNRAKPSAGSHAGVSGSSTVESADPRGGRSWRRGPFFSPGGRTCQADRSLHRLGAMLHLVKRSLIGLGILALVGFAPRPLGAGALDVAVASSIPLGLARVGAGGAAAARDARDADAQPARATGVTAPTGTGPLAAAPRDVGPPRRRAARRPTPGAPSGAARRARRPMTPQQLYEHVLRGVVALERNGVPMAIGTVLSGDGRVLTALSGLAGADGADVRYADGTVVHAKVGRSDRGVGPGPAGPGVPQVDRGPERERRGPGRPGAPRDASRPRRASGPRCARR